MYTAVQKKYQLINQFFLLKMYAFPVFIFFYSETLLFLFVKFSKIEGVDGRG